MKANFLLASLVITLTAIPAFAGITPTEATSPEYLYNHGHSSATVEIVQMNKAGANGEKYVSAQKAKEANEPKLVRWVKKVFIYLDPAMDDGSFMQHDINPSPSYEDL